MDNISSRLQYLIEHYEKVLSDTLFQREGQVFDIPQAVLKFSEFDPSRNKSATQWLVKTYLAKGFRFEDLSKAHETLKLFGLYRGKLEVTERDLNRYNTLAQVWKSLEGFVDTSIVSGKEQRRLEKEEAYRESKILIEEEDWTVVVPLSRKASCWWGKGTRWCTASNKDNYYHNYAHEPLIIIIVKGEKFQLYAERYNFQFMNARDEDVTQEEFEKYKAYFKTTINWAIKRCPETVEWLSYRKLLDADMALLAVSRNGSLLEHIPPNLHSDEVLNTAVQQNGRALYSVDYRKKTYDLCLKAVTSTVHHPHALYNVPEEFLDNNLLHQALDREVYFEYEVLRSILDFFSDKTLSPELILKIASKNEKIWPLIPSYCRTKDFDKEILKFFPKLIQIIFRPTQEMNRIAVRHNGCMLQHIKDESIDLDMCVDAVKNDPYAMLYVPKKYQTSEFFQTVLEHNIQAFTSMPTDKKTYDLCIKAISADYHLMRHVPMRLLDKEICDIAYKLSPSSIAYFPSRYITLEMCEKAILHDIFNFQYLRTHFLTESLDGQFLKNLVRQKPGLLSHIAPVALNEELIKVAVEADFRVITIVPNHFKTLEIAKLVVAGNSRYINEFSKEIQESLLSEMSVVMQYDDDFLDIVSARPTQSLSW